MMVVSILPYAKFGQNANRFKFKASWWTEIQKDKEHVPVWGLFISHESMMLIKKFNFLEFQTTIGCFYLNKIYVF